MVFLRIIRPGENYIFRVHKDVLLYIFSLLDDCSTVNITSTCKYFNNLGKTLRENSRYNLWNKTYSKTWKIPEDIVASEDEVFGDEDLSIALDYFKGNNVDLRRGDLIEFEYNSGYRNDGLTIYNGSKIINLCYEDKDDYGYLPPEFKAIDEFPIEYFHINGINDEKTRNICHNSIIWFDHKPYLDQILLNIRQDRLLCSVETVYTYFIHKNKRKYYIVLCDDDSFDYIFLYNNESIQILKPDSLEKFKNILVQEDNISFASDDEYTDGILPFRSKWKIQNIEVLFIDRCSYKI